jgi:integrase
MGNKTELRTPLGPDYRSALRLLPGAVAELQHKIALAERSAAGATGRTVMLNRYPLAPDQIAFRNYQDRLALDEYFRNGDPRYANPGSIDDELVRQLRDGIAGRLRDDQLLALIGDRIERYRHLGNTGVEFGSTEWRTVARALCVSEYEALSRVAERDEGDYSGTPAHPLIVNAPPPPDEKEQPVSLTGLWADYINSRIQAGFMRDKGLRHRPVINSLRKFLKHNDAARITRKDVLAWRDHLMKTLSAKTVNDIYLSGVKSVLTWAVENDRLPENVAAIVRQPKPRKVYGRERGYTDIEAVQVLIASRAYQSKADEFGRVRESVQMADVKRWVPIICAFTGARVSEIIQLRKEDIIRVNDQWVARITPDAGTVKSGGYRDVPLHRQIIAEGFEVFLEAANPGPLFHTATDPKKFQRAAIMVSNKLSDWLRLSGLCPDGLQPSHAWRHRLKTTCREIGISDRVVDAIQGHAGKTAGDNYGDVTLKTKADAIAKLPDYPI